MTNRSKWLLGADAIMLVLLIAFISDLALVLPAYSRVDFWGSAWPPFVGNGYIRIPDRAVYACFCALAATAGVLLVYGLIATVTWTRTLFVHRKLRARG
jgi:hypothetical protein